MALPEPPTNLAPTGWSWRIDDALVRLRIWGTEHAYPLLEPCTIKLGSGPACDMRLRDGSGRISREHALLAPAVGGWIARDLGSTNGLWVEGSRVAERVLCPGATLQLGDLTLVAESLEFIRLRSLVCRLVGWAPERSGAVDEVLQCLRDGAMQRTPIVLVGDGYLPPVARRLHRLTLGGDAPFVAHHGGDAVAAVREVEGGTLCVPIRSRSAADAITDAVLAVELAARPRLVLCAAGAGQAATVGSRPGRSAVIALPPLSSRGAEIARLVHETAQDVATAMGVPASGFTMRDLERLQTIRFTGMADLEDTIRRVIAIRTFGVTAGAKRLGLKHPSLSQWARNRKRRLLI